MTPEQALAIARVELFEFEILFMSDDRYDVIERYRIVGRAAVLLDWYARVTLFPAEA